MIVVSDTGPLNYLVLIGAANCLPALFGKINIPCAVESELAHPETPPKVSAWIADPPSWLRIVGSTRVPRPEMMRLGDGEREALTLADELSADLVLVDDRQARETAHRIGLAVIGTLGVLDRAAMRGLVDIRSAIGDLCLTNFRCRQEIIDEMLRQHDRSGSSGRYRDRT